AAPGDFDYRLTTHEVVEPAVCTRHRSEQRPITKVASDISENRSEKRACARDSRALADPETAPGGPNRQDRRILSVRAFATSTKPGPIPRRSRVQPEGFTPDSGRVLTGVPPQNLIGEYWL